eukprot:gene25292-10946_t
MSLLIASNDIFQDLVVALVTSYALQLLSRLRLVALVTLSHPLRDSIPVPASDASPVPRVAATSSTPSPSAPPPPGLRALRPFLASAFGPPLPSPRVLRPPRAGAPSTPSRAVPRPLPPSGPLPSRLPQPVSSALSPSSPSAPTPSLRPHPLSFRHLLTPLIAPSSPQSFHPILAPGSLIPPPSPSPPSSPLHQYHPLPGALFPPRTAPSSSTANLVHGPSPVPSFPLHGNPLRCPPSRTLYIPLWVFPPPPVGNPRCGPLSESASPHLCPSCVPSPDELGDATLGVEANRSAPSTPQEHQEGSGDSAPPWTRGPASQTRPREAERGGYHGTRSPRSRVPPNSIIPE